MKIPIVDKNDNVICYKDRSKVDYSKDIFRTASIWIMNDAGQTLLAQRKYSKDIDAGKWGEAVGGTVDNNDSYLDTAIRESYEELGISDIRLHPEPKQFLETPIYSCYIQWYMAHINKEISELVIQQDEVEQVAWIPVEEFKRDLDANPDKYVTGLAKCVELLKV